ncbi:MAG: LLM class flavin-dependent oxidoreductase, partial [Deltaproteobacteria bacterium]
MERIALGLMPLRDASPREVVAWSQRAEALGFEAVFISESYGDSLAYAEAVALATDRLRVGTAITNIYLRQPTLLAEQAAAVQEFSGGRLLLGLGVGHRAVNQPLGIDMGDPLAKMRQVIGTLRSAWTGGPHQPRPAIPPKVLAAALAERMIELAGELTDGPIFNLFPLARYPRALAALGRGAAR